MYFQTDGVSKVLCSLRVPFPEGTANVIEQSEVGLIDAGVPSRQKVVNGVVVSKTEAEYTADCIAEWTAGVQWISKYYVIQKITELGKYDEGIALLKSNDVAYQEWLAATDLSRTNAVLLGMLSTLSITMDQLLDGYYAYVQSLNPLR